MALHQKEAETATANEKARATHSWRDLKARVKCTKAVMKAKYEYHMAVQEARAGVLSWKNQKPPIPKP